MLLLAQRQPELLTNIFEKAKKDESLAAAIANSLFRRYDNQLLSDILKKEKPTLYTKIVDLAKENKFINIALHYALLQNPSTQHYNQFIYFTRNENIDPAIIVNLFKKNEHKQPSKIC